MCFSASASFVSGIVLSAIGVASIKKVHHQSQVFFASIPLIFGVQQFAEGLLWITLDKPEYLLTQKIATYAFLFFAQIVWPIWVPISILFLEKVSTRRIFQKILVGFGLVTGVYLAYCLITMNVFAKIEGHHIKYSQQYPSSLRIYCIIFYGIVTIIPPFFSHIKRMWILSVSIFISYIFTAIFYDHYILSVWCFFSSIISLSVYGIMIEIENSTKIKLKSIST